MPGRDTVNLLGGYLGSQQYELQEEGRPGTEPFITISRQAGAGGQEIGLKLRDTLRERDTAAPKPWIWLDRELIQEVIRDHNLPAEMACMMQETQYNRLLQMVDSILGHHPAWSSVVRDMSETIVHLAEIGNCIIVGRGSHLLTHGMLRGVHVRLVAPLQTRITRIAEHYDLDRRKARRYIDREDSGRAAYLRDHFSSDIDASEAYDLTINTGHLSYDDAVGIIVDRVLRVRSFTLGDVARPGRPTTAAPRGSNEIRNGG